MGLRTPRSRVQIPPGSLPSDTREYINTGPKSKDRTKKNAEKGLDGPEPLVSVIPTPKKGYILETVCENGHYGETRISETFYELIREYGSLAIRIAFRCSCGAEIVSYRVLNGREEDVTPVGAMEDAAVHA